MRRRCRGMFPVLLFDSYTMSISILVVIITIVATLVFIASLGSSGFVFFNMFRTLRWASRDTERHRGEWGADRKRRVLDIVSQQLPHIAAYKCGKCGATVDSTAELSAGGKVRCNYCNEWSSIL